MQEVKTTLARTAAAAAEMNESPGCLKTIAGQLLTVIHRPLQAFFEGKLEQSQMEAD